MAIPSTEAGTRLFTHNQVHAPARSAALITAAMSGAFPPAGGRALEAASTEVVSMVAVVDDIADGRCAQVERSENSRMERNTMLDRILIFVQLECKSFVRFAVAVLC